MLQYYDSLYSATRNPRTNQPRHEASIVHRVNTTTKDELSNAALILDMAKQQLGDNI